MFINTSSPCEYVQNIMTTGLALKTSVTLKKIKYYVEMIKSKNVLKERLMNNEYGEHRHKK